MAIDEELINRSNQEKEATDSSESDAPDSDKEENNEEGSAQESAARAGNLREAVQREKNGENLQSQGDLRADTKAASRAQKEKEDTKEKKESEENTSTPMSKATGNLLKSAWENLITSWGATLIWIDIHVLANQVFGPKVFCDLGEEWLQANAAKTFGKSAKKSVGLVESMGCGCLNLGCLLLVLSIACIIAMIAGFWSNPFAAISSLLTGIWHNLTGG